MIINIVSILIIINEVVDILENFKISDIYLYDNLKIIIYKLQKALAFISFSK
jgi:hypothetical protein